MSNSSKLITALVIVALLIAGGGGYKFGKLSVKIPTESIIDTTIIRDTIYINQDSIVYKFSKPKIQLDTIYVDTMNCDTMKRRYIYEITDSSFEFFRIKVWALGRVIDGGAEYKLKPLPTIIEKHIVTIKEPFDVVKLDTRLKVLGGITYVHDTAIPNIGFMKHRFIGFVGYDFTQKPTSWKNLQVSGLWVF